jgi:hypothetical protein
MSYEIVKGIRISEDGTVKIMAASNNCFPRDYSWEQWKRAEEILKTEGREALDIYIMEKYESGTFHPGTRNKYTRALAILRHTPEYKDYDWRGETPKDRTSEEFKNLLAAALEAKPPKEKFVISKVCGGQKVYGKVTSRAIIWKTEPNKATKYNYKADTERVAGYYHNNTSFVVEQI